MNRDAPFHSAEVFEVMLDQEGQASETTMVPTTEKKRRKIEAKCSVMVESLVPVSTLSKQHRANVLGSFFNFSFSLQSMNPDSFEITAPGVASKLIRIQSLRVPIVDPATRLADLLASIAREQETESLEAKKFASTVQLCRTMKDRKNKNDNNNNTFFEDFCIKPTRQALGLQRVTGTTRKLLSKKPVFNFHFPGGCVPLVFRQCASATCRPVIDLWPQHCNQAPIFPTIVNYAVGEKIRQLIVNPETGNDIDEKKRFLDDEEDALGQYRIGNTYSRDFDVSSLCNSHNEGCCNPLHSVMELQSVKCNRSHCCSGERCMHEPQCLAPGKWWVDCHDARGISAKGLFTALWKVVDVKKPVPANFKEAILLLQQKEAEIVAEQVRLANAGMSSKDITEYFNEQAMQDLVDEIQKTHQRGHPTIKNQKCPPCLHLFADPKIKTIGTLDAGDTHEVDSWVTARTNQPWKEKGTWIYNLLHGSSLEIEMKDNLHDKSKSVSTKAAALPLLARMRMILRWKEHAKLIAKGGSASRMENYKVEDMYPYLNALTYLEIALMNGTYDDEVAAENEKYYETQQDAKALCKKVFAGPHTIGCHQFVWYLLTDCWDERWGVFGGYMNVSLLNHQRYDCRWENTSLETNQLNHARDVCCPPGKFNFAGQAVVGCCEHHPPCTAAGKRWYFNFIRCYFYPNDICRMLQNGEEPRDYIPEMIKSVSKIYVHAYILHVNVRCPLFFPYVTPDSYLDLGDLGHPCATTHSDSLHRIRILLDLVGSRPSTNAILRRIISTSETGQIMYQLAFTAPKTEDGGLLQRVGANASDIDLFKLYFHPHRHESCDWLQSFLIKFESRTATFLCPSNNTKFRIMGHPDDSAAEEVQRDYEFFFSETAKKRVKETFIITALFKQQIWARKVGGKGGILELEGIFDTEAQPLHQLNYIVAKKTRVLYKNSSYLWDDNLFWKLRNDSDNLGHVSIFSLPEYKLADSGHRIPWSIGKFISNQMRRDLDDSITEIVPWLLQEKAKENVVRGLLKAEDEKRSKKAKALFEEPWTQIVQRIVRNNNGEVISIDDASMKGVPMPWTIDPSQVDQTLDYAFLTDSLFRDERHGPFFLQRGTRRARAGGENNGNDDQNENDSPLNVVPAGKKMRQHEASKQQAIEESPTKLNTAPRHVKSEKVVKRTRSS